MPGTALDHHPVARAARNRGDDAGWTIAVQQHRPLLDMHFEIAHEILRPPREPRNRFGLAADAKQRIREAYAIAIAPLQQRLIKTPRNHAAADIGRAEAHALLL